MSSLSYDGAIKTSLGAKFAQFELYHLRAKMTIYTLTEPCALVRALRYLRHKIYTICTLSAQYILQFTCLTWFLPRMHVLDVHNICCHSNTFLSTSVLYYIHSYTFHFITLLHLLSHHLLNLIIHSLSHILFSSSSSLGFKFVQHLSWSLEIFHRDPNRWILTFYFNTTYHVFCISLQPFKK